MLRLKYSYLILFAFCFVAGLNAQHPMTRLKLSIHTDHRLSGKIERFLNTKESISLGYAVNNTYGGKRGNDSFFFQNAERLNIGQRFQLEYRRYFKEFEKGNIYYAPSISYGRHKVKYHKGTRSNSTYTSGKAEVKGGALGLGLGYQKSGKSFLYDVGLNLNHNFVVGSVQGIDYDDGTYRTFDNDLSGFHPELYFGIGLVF